MIIIIICKLYIWVLHFYISIFSSYLHYRAGSDWAIARWEMGVVHFCTLHFVFLYFAFCIFALCIFLYLAASDWAIARWEAGDLSCARTEEGFVIRVTNEAGQPSSLFIVIIDIIIIIIAMTSGVLWQIQLEFLVPIFWAVPCYQWKRSHVRVEGEHITTLNDQTKTGTPETGKQWWRCK